jgi:hypothetical protein
MRLSSLLLVGSGGKTRRYPLVNNLPLVRNTRWTNNVIVHIYLEFAVLDQ